jgi:hypothetical protein
MLVSSKYGIGSVTINIINVLDLCVYTSSKLCLRVFDMVTSDINQPSLTHTKDRNIYSTMVQVLKNSVILAKIFDNF